MSAKIISFQDKKQSKERSGAQQRTFRTQTNDHYSSDQPYDFMRPDVQKACGTEHHRQTLKTFWPVYVICSVFLFALAVWYPALNTFAYTSILSMLAIYIYASVGQTRFGQGIVLPFGIAEKLPSK